MDLVSTFPLHYANPSAGPYRGVHLKLLKMRLRWLGQPYLKKSTFSKPLFLTASAIGGVIDFFANLSPYLASRLWCYWVGGFEEIEYRFQVIKS
jgi:hypothetical protein